MQGLVSSIGALGATLVKVPRASVVALVLAATALPAGAAHDACGGVATCRDLGPFTATVVRVNVTRQDTVTAYQGVRTTVRFTNVSERPIVLAYRDHSSSVTDDKGLAYRWSAKAYGIGLVTRDSADPQFRLAPGESREASFDGTLQYSLRRQVAGSVFSHDITIVQLEVVNGRQVREARDHVVSFSRLTADAGYAAAPSPPRPRPGAEAPPAETEPPVPVAAPQGEAAAPPVAHGSSQGGCSGGACQATGPLMARVVRVNVTRSGNVTAYQTVRTMVRFTNTGREPLVLAYRQGSGAVSDNTGQSYRFAFKAEGIGIVDRGAADPQFRLAPGESREAAFAATLQYSVRRSAPGDVFSQDMTIDQLAVVGPGQVRTLHEYALGFSNLSAGGVGGGDPAGTARAESAPRVNKVVELIKGLGR